MSVAVISLVRPVSCTVAASHGCGILTLVFEHFVVVLHLGFWPERDVFLSNTVKRRSATSTTETWVLPFVMAAAQNQGRVAFVLVFRNEGRQAR